MHVLSVDFITFLSLVQSVVTNVFDKLGLMPVLDLVEFINNLIWSVFTILGKHEIQEIADRLNVRPREDLVQAAHRFYTVGLSNF